MSVENESSSDHPLKCFPNLHGLHPKSPFNKTTILVIFKATIRGGFILVRHCRVRAKFLARETVLLSRDGGVVALVGQKNLIECETFQGVGQSAFWP